MKLNFWQWIGILVLAAGIAIMFYEKWPKTANPNPAPPATKPN